MSIRSTREGGYNKTEKVTRRARLVGLSRSNSRWHLFSTATAMFSVAFLVTFLCSSILTPARNTNAETVTESSSASGYTLSLSATPVVNLNVGVSEVPVMTVGVGTVSTSTTAPGGYKLYLFMAGTSNDLRHTGSDAGTISATTGTMADSSALGIGEWGYAIPSTTPNISATDFDTSYDIMESAYPSSKGFAAPPISTTTAQLITSTNSPNTTANDIYVYYGINADDTTPLGNYTGSVVWTAIADAAETASASVSPANGAPVGGETITVSTSLFSTSGVTGDVYMLTDAQYQQITPSNPVSSLGVSPMTCNKTSASNLTFACTTPANTAGNNYHVYVDIPRYEKTYEASFTYFKGPSLDDISNMQDMTSEICSNTTIGEGKSLKDTRDNKSYTVKKLNDGRCWMTQNLWLVGPISASNLNSTNTDVAPGSTFALPASKDDTWCTTTSTSTNCVNELRMLDSKNADYGAYYNWRTATAGTGTYDLVSADATSSICPKGWKLPTGGDSGEFQALTDAETDLLDINGPNFKLAGYRMGNSMQGTTTSGYYWSSTARERKESAAMLWLNPTRANRPGKCYGYSVRCIAVAE